MAKLPAIAPSIFLCIFGTSLFVHITAAEQDVLPSPGSPLMIGKGLGFFETYADAVEAVPADAGLEHVKVFCIIIHRFYTIITNKKE